MLYKSILKVVGVVAAIAAVMFMGCDGDKGVDPNDPNYTYTGKTVIIGGKVWMAENLNRATANSKCYGNDASNCAKWGRLYTWAGAENACPAGWHLPSDAEWTVLTDYLGDIGDASTVGKRLKSTTGWSRGYGTDDYGVSALPGGYGYSDGSFNYAGDEGNWWSATEYTAGYAWSRNMDSRNEYVVRSIDDKTELYSVRCVAD
jgi:uncharacterized protein (TIGR02145 family)